MNELEEQELLDDGKFYVCEHHQKTGGYESCCECDGDRLCTKALEKLRIINL
jgi:hypothetical protein